tara:strand:+ start:571 stop:744 length:174 start_codon:yes stop_codon:yes gene_type:complete
MVGAVSAGRVPLFTKLTAIAKRFSILPFNGCYCHPKKLNGLIGWFVTSMAGAFIVSV